MTSPRNSIETIRRTKRITLEAVATAINEDPDNGISTASASTISKIEKGKNKLTDRWIGPIAKALGVSKADILAEPGSPQVWHAVPDRTARIAETQTARQLPVRGTAAGSVIGADVLSNEPLEWLPCPPGLAGVRDAYVLWVDGESMAPRFEPGDPLFVHPHRPVRQGDDVVVQVNAKGNVKALVKRFVRQTETHVVVLQFSPAAEIRIPREEIIAIHRILKPAEIAGISIR